METTADARRASVSESSDSDSDEASIGDDEAAYSDASVVDLDAAYQLLTFHFGDDGCRYERHPDDPRWVLVTTARRCPDDSRWVDSQLGEGETYSVYDLSRFDSVEDASCVWSGERLMIHSAGASGSLGSTVRFAPGLPAAIITDYGRQELDALLCATATSSPPPPGPVVPLDILVGAHAYAHAASRSSSTSTSPHGGPPAFAGLSTSTSPPSSAPGSANSSLHGGQMVQRAMAQQVRLVVPVPGGATKGASGASSPQSASPSGSQNNLAQAAMVQQVRLVVPGTGDRRRRPSSLDLNS